MGPVQVAAFQGARLFSSAGKGFSISKKPRPHYLNLGLVRIEEKSPCKVLVERNSVRNGMKLSGNCRVTHKLATLAT